MMNNQEVQRQFQAAKQMAGQSGIIGVVYLDVDPARGSLRVKFKVTPAEEQNKLVISLAYVVDQMSQAFGLQVITREEKNEEVNNV
ncbi:MAG: hypothetical protein Q8O55_10250 [Dehalococcoidales bacterium]|nr:hypothetical protein [Dehalococcoidales bacterium]